MISTTTDRSSTIRIYPYAPIEVNFGSLLKTMSDAEFFDFCQRHADLRIERESDGEIIIMPPTFSETGRKNFNLLAEFAVWSKQNGTGIGFDSSTGFTLPNGAVRSPDLSWIRLERWNNLSEEDREGFARIAPDFVVELRSQSDSLSVLQNKMREYIENGVSLGWLIDAAEHEIYVYRPGEEVLVPENPSQVSGDPVLAGFTLDLREIWE